MSFYDLIGSAIAGTSWFDEAIREARKGLGFTHPNPPVGCVIVKNDQLIAKAYHTRAGESHAEALALERAGAAAQGATLYVTLEPCNHFGRTPPCTQAIIQAGISRVVYGVSDPNPKVLGHGCQALREAGIVVEAIADPGQIARAQDLILAFRKLVQHKRPYVLAKIACSLDGKIAFRAGEQTPITSPETKILVHQMREACDAVLIGSETVLVDNPRLTARFEDRPALRQPIRIVLDSRLRTNLKHQVYAQDGVQSYVVCGPKASKAKIQEFEQAGVICVKVENGHPGPLCHPGLDPGSKIPHQVRNDKRAGRELGPILEHFAGLGLSSILVEGGGVLLTSFLEQNHIDELAWFMAPVILGNQGVPAISNLSKALTISSCQTVEFLSKDRLWLISSVC